MRGKTDYERFAAQAGNRRMLRREELALEATEAIALAMERAGVTRAELARRLGRTRGYVTQLLGGGRNLTLGTLAEVADALECSASLRFSAPGHAQRAASRRSA